MIPKVVYLTYKARSSSYLNIDPRPQKMPHFFQDLFLQSIPGHSALHVQYKRQAKPCKTERMSV